MALKAYRNGNYTVVISDKDGSKYRVLPDEEEKNGFQPAFPESMDMNITMKCDNGCLYCYANCTPEGKHADFKKYERFLDSIHPYTELAVNGNDLSHPDLEWFLEKMKSKNVFVNMTVSKRHFMEHWEKLLDWTKNKLIYGIGISWDSKSTDGFGDTLKLFPNAVIHIIAGIHNHRDMLEIRSSGARKILILGYKNKGRGVKYGEEYNILIEAKQKDMKAYLSQMFKVFECVVFDNNALEQLDIKNVVNEETWNDCYMGQEGSATMYVDLVNGYYARSSSEPTGSPCIPLRIDDKWTVDYIFQDIKERYAIRHIETE